MLLPSIRNLNLFTTLATGYIGIMSSERDDTIFMLELKECSKRIYDMSLDMSLPDFHNYPQKS